MMAGIRVTDACAPPAPAYAHTCGTPSCVPATAIAVVGRGMQGLLVATGPNVREPQNRRVEIVIAQMAAAAPMNDAAYCKALAAKWRALERTDASGPAPQAIAKCDAGDYAAGIPVLVKMLTDSKVPLPPRT